MCLHPVVRGCGWLDCRDTGCSMLLATPSCLSGLGRRLAFMREQRFLLAAMGTPSTAKASSSGAGIAASCLASEDSRGLCTLGHEPAVSCND